MTGRFCAHNAAFHLNDVRFRLEYYASGQSRNFNWTLLIWCPSYGEFLVRRSYNCWRSTMLTAYPTGFWLIADEIYRQHFPVRVLEDDIPNKDYDYICREVSGTINSRIRASRHLLTVTVNPLMANDSVPRALQRSLWFMRACRPIKLIPRKFFVTVLRRKDLLHFHSCLRESGPQGWELPQVHGVNASSLLKGHNQRVFGCKKAVGPCP